MFQVWDLRKMSALFELSTGNNVPRHIAWNHATTSLVCATASSHGTTTGWPVNAVHAPNHFPRKFNCGYNAMLQYDFVSLV
jgi:hypothetical protein